jgi:NAD+ diphosphatase
VEYHPADRFVPSTAFASPPQRGTWLIFRERTLLVSLAHALPAACLPHELGATPLRTQYLGMLDGEPCFAAEVPSDSEAPAEMLFRDLRALYGRMSDELVALAGRAVQIMDFDRTHQFCGACAAPTRPDEKARARVCTRQGCGLSQFPRLAPAMIVLVQRGEELLLARSPHFPLGIYSTLAGFVDPGESVEDAVHREVFEEVSVSVRNLRYFGSQPWPFPNSLMLGFRAEYAGGEIRVDGREIEDAAFFPMHALPSLFPGRISIGNQMLAEACAERGFDLP